MSLICKMFGHSDDPRILLTGRTVELNGRKVGATILIVELVCKRCRRRISRPGIIIPHDGTPPLQEGKSNG